MDRPVRTPSQTTAPTIATIRVDLESFALIFPVQSQVWHAPRVVRVVQRVLADALAAHWTLYDCKLHCQWTHNDPDVWAPQPYTANASSKRLARTGYAVLTEAERQYVTAEDVVLVQVSFLRQDVDHLSGLLSSQLGQTVHVSKVDVEGSLWLDESDDAIDDNDVWDPLSPSGKAMSTGSVTLTVVGLLLGMAMNFL